MKDFSQRTRKGGRGLGCFPRLSRGLRRLLNIESLERRDLMAVLAEAGSLVDEIALREDQVLAQNSNAYVAPNASQMADFQTLAEAIRGQDLVAADALAASLDYELVEFTDTNTNHLFYLLREELVNGSPTRGWGTYIINPTFNADVLVEAPHPIHDLRAEDVGIRAFLDAGARGFLMAGAHRSANGYQTADVAHIADSIFHQVHIAWSGAGGDTQAWQMHGFDFDGHADEFPVGTDVVLSSGDGGVSPEVVELDDHFDSHAYDSYAYNTLPVNDPLNAAVNDNGNGAEPGVSFSSLGGTTNVQGIYTRGQGGRFVHVEMEQDIRGSQATRIDLAQQVAAALTATNSFFVTNSQFNQAGNDRTLTIDFRLPIDGASVAAGDLVIDGQAASAVQVIDADTVRFTLPVMSVGSHQAVLGHGSILALAGTNLRAYDTTLLFEAPATPVEVSFQDGLNGYASTVDTYLDEAGPTSSKATNTSVWVDGETSPGTADERQALLRFDNLFGNAVGQIPDGATILSAQLHLNVTDAGNAFQLHRMLQTWNETSTWNLLAGGVQTDGVEADVSAELSTGAVATGELVLDVFASVTSWQANPGSNHGWVLVPTGNNGVKWDSSEGATQTARPKLTIAYLAPNNTQPAAQDDAIVTSEETPANIAVLANDTDADGHPLTVTGATNGALGTTVVNNDGTITYTPNANASGQDSFTYTVSDGHGGTANGTVSVTILSSAQSVFEELRATALFPVVGKTLDDVESTFGPRIRVSTNEYDWHRGIDIDAALGTDVIAPVAGTLFDVVTYDDGGLTVILRHEFPEPVLFAGKTLTSYFTFYMHLSAVAPALQAAADNGQTPAVAQGAVLGQVGHSGNAHGDHLHWELRIGSPYSLEGQLDTPNGIWGSNNFGFDSHVHPLWLTEPTQTNTLDAVLLTTPTNLVDGQVRISTDDLQPLFNRVQVTIENLVTNTIEASHTLDLNERLGFDATTNAALDTVDDTKPYFAPIEFGTSAANWESDLIIPKTWVGLNSGAGFRTTVTVTDIWGRSNSVVWETPPVVVDPQYTMKHNPRLQPGNAPLDGFGYAGSNLDRVDVMWQTIPGGAGTQDSFVVEYRAAGVGAWQAATVNAPIVTGVEGRLVWSASITGLSWNSNYEYRVRHIRGNMAIADYASEFRTRLQLGDATSFSFAAYGDSARGSDPSGFRQVQSRINQVNPQFSVLLGDNVYSNGTHLESDARFDPLLNPEAAAWMAGHIDYLGLGNHDVGSGSGLPTEQNYSVPIPVAGVTAPAAPPMSERPEHSFSWDYGNVHFVTFDTNSFSSTSRLDGLLDWVVADLNASNARWKIVYGHHPLGGVPDKPENPGDNYYQQVVNRLKAAGVDLFMTGHSHTYGWTYPLTGQINGTATFEDHGHDDHFHAGEGLVQLVSGVGGAGLRDGSFGQFAFVAEGFSSTTSVASKLGFSKIDVTPNSLTVSYIAADNGAVIDSFQVVKEVTQTASFQQGADGYAGTVDTYLHQNTPDTNRATATTLVVDNDDPASSGLDVQALLRFDNLFGNAPGQIPTGAVLRSATLQLEVSDGSAYNVNLHRMLTPWSDTDTWNSQTGGIQTDGVEATVAPDTSTGTSQVGTTWFNVLSSLRAWQNDPSSNFGWAFVPTNADNMIFGSSEAVVRPKLIVTWVEEGPNSPPVAQDNVASTNIDAPVAINVLSNDYDPNGDTLSVISTTSPAHGSVVVNPNQTVTYTPAPGYSGNDSFSYTISDGHGGEASATVNVTISATPNSPPVAQNDNVGTTQNTPIAISVLTNDSDPNGDALSVVSTTSPAHGSVVVNPNQTVTYTPTASYTGGDSFTYTVSDGHGGHAVATVNVTVSATPNSPPVAQNDNVGTTQNTPIAISVLTNDSDPNGDALSVVSTTSPAHGSVVVNPNQTVTYTPTAGYTGSDSFTYTVSDGRGGQAVATVNATVTPVGNSQTVNFQQGQNGYTGTTDTYIKGSTPNTTYGAAVELTVDTDTGSGKAAQALIQFQNLFGDNPGQIPVDATLVSATLQLNVTNSGDPLALHRMLANWSGNSTWNALNGGVQNDGIDAVVAADVTTGAVPLGTLAINVLSSFQAWLANPASNFGWAILPTGSNGVDFDSAEGTTPPKLIVEFIPSTNVRPVAVDDPLNTNEDTPVAIAVLANDSDSDGGVLSVTGASQGQLGTTTVNPDGTITYTPNANVSGVDSFTYTITDGQGGPATATVTVTIAAVNDAPIAVNDAVNTPEDAAAVISVVTNDSDIENDTLSIIGTTNGANGSVVVNPDGTLTYTLAANFNGQDSFTYTISDGNGGSAQATVFVTVNSVNDAPVAASDAVVTNEDTPLEITVLTNDSDIDGGTLSVTGRTNGLKGTTVLNPNGTITYTPNLNANGEDTFTYTLSDGQGGSSIGTVTVTINAVNDAPVAANDSVGTHATNAVVISVLGNDSDVEGNPLTVSLVSQPAHGSAVLNLDGTVAYTANANYFGADSFTYRVNDGQANSNVATVNVTISQSSVFRQGLNGYAGTVDTFFREDQPATSKATSTPLSVDGDYPTGTGHDDQALLRFDQIIGSGIGQIPINATLLSATLQLKVTNSGDAVPMHRVLTPWSATDTWNTFGGIQADGVEAVATPELTLADGVSGTITLDVLPSIMQWLANPTSNRGWVFLPTGADGLDFASSEATDATTRPQLYVVFIPQPVIAPVAGDDSEVTNEDTPIVINVLANDSDADNGLLTVTSATAGQFGTTSINPNGTVTYTPNANVSGVDSFTYSLNDLQGGTTTGTVTVTVNAVNDAPVAGNDSANTTGITPILIDLLANDSDIEASPLTASIVSQPSIGSVVLNPNGTATYTTAGGFVGQDSFTYKVNDGAADSNVATVNITVAAMPKFFVVDSSADKTFRYTAAGDYLAQASLNGSNGNSRGVAANMDGTRMWVIDSNRTIFVYDANQLLLGSWMANGPSTPTGVTVSGKDLWISDNGNDRVYFYAGGANLLSGSSAATSSFAVANGNGNSGDLVTDGTTIWVTQSSTTDSVFVYTTAGQLLGSWTLPAANKSPVGITLDPAGGSQHLWIVDSSSDRIYEYTNARSRTSGTQAAATSYLLHASNGSAQGIADPRAFAAYNASLSAPIAAVRSLPDIHFSEVVSSKSERQQERQFLPNFQLRVPEIHAPRQSISSRVNSVVPAEETSRYVVGLTTPRSLGSVSGKLYESDSFDGWLSVVDNLFASGDFLSKMIEELELSGGPSTFPKLEQVSRLLVRYAKTASQIK